MRFSQLAGTCLLALASLSAAENIPANHYLWGEKGPAGNNVVVKRATTTTKPTSSSTKASSSSVKTSSTSSSVKASSTTTAKVSSSSTPSKTSSSSPSATSKVADSACSNGPLTRSCWASGYSIATDFDAKWPTTGKTVYANLELFNTTCNPDGNGERLCMLFNNQYPGPTIRANWGDTVQVTVKNSLQNNGTSIHWHGLRQLGTTSQDGVNGITECPLAPGDTKVYTFKATQFGTSWYHSHYSSQYGDGAVGAIIIDGPATANYDVDLGAYPVNDWYYSTAFQIESISFANLQKATPAPPGDNILVNGKNKNSAGSGSYDVQTLTKGKKYRLRLINTSVDNNIRVSLDNHQFQVITSDFVPIKPFYTNWVLLGIGQRYDVIINANQTAGNYWFRAEVATACASANNFYGRSIFSYSGVASGTPSSTAFTAPGGCVDEVTTPFVSNTVPSATFLDQAKNLNVDLNIEQLTTNGKNIVFWGINLTSIDIDWRKPTLQYVKEGNTSYPSAYNLIEIPQPGVVSHLNPSVAPFAASSIKLTPHRSGPTGSSKRPTAPKSPSLTLSTSTATTSTSSALAPASSIRPPTWATSTSPTQRVATSPSCPARAGSCSRSLPITQALGSCTATSRGTSVRGLVCSSLRARGRSTCLGAIGIIRARTGASTTTAIPRISRSTLGCEPELLFVTDAFALHHGSSLEKCPFMHGATVGRGWSVLARHVFTISNAFYRGFSKNLLYLWDRCTIPSLTPSNRSCLLLFSCISRWRFQRGTAF